MRVLMKIGIWGAGFVAHTHTEAIKGEGVEIFAVVDNDLQQAAEFANKWGIAHFGSDPAILLGDDISVVHVCTPPVFHYDMVLKLLDAGKHILCEKPLCLDNEQADELARRANEKRVVCAVNFNVRFHQACKKAVEIVSTPDFGSVYLIHGSYMQEFHALPAWSGWRYDPELAGKMRAVTEIGSHWMDIAQCISGKRITHVSAILRNFNPTRKLEDGIMHAIGADNSDDKTDELSSCLVNVTSEDAATVNFRFEDGAIGTALFSEISHGRINRLSLEVTGANNSLWWNSEENNLLHTATKDSGVNTQVFAFGNGFTDTFRDLIRAFYADVRVGVMPENPIYPSFDEGANIVRLCNAVYESAQNDACWVEV